MTSVCDAPGDSRSDLWFIYHLGKRLKQLYADSTEAKDRPIQDLTWDYPERMASGTSRTQKPCCGRSTATPWPTASRSRNTRT